MKRGPKPDFWGKVNRDGEAGCWTWTGGLSNGYGQVTVDCASKRAHRVSYEMLVGPIPEGLHLDHLCRNRACVNPAHLEPVTQAENNRRARAAAPPRPKQHLCKRGHDLDENSYIRPGTIKRQCRECDNQVRRERYRAQKHGDLMAGPLAPLLTIFERDVIAERWRQLKLWGRQSHPDGTGHPGDRALADFYKKLCDAQFEHGSGTWRHILAEEVAEAFAESERQPLRAELIQVATVALAWVEDLDRRAGDREPPVPTVLPKLGDEKPYHLRPHYFAVVGS